MSNDTWRGLFLSKLMVLVDSWWNCHWGALFRREGVTIDVRRTCTGWW